MARKSLLDIDPKLTAALEDFKSVSEIKYELAKEAYDAQDAETRRVIDRIHGTLQTSATGYVNLVVNRAVYPVKIEADYLGFNLLYLAVEIVKDLGIMGIRVANWKFAETLCASCGAEIIGNKRGK